MALEERLQQLTYSKVLLLGLLIAGLYYAIGYDNGKNLKNSAEQMKVQIKEKAAEIKDLELQAERIINMKKMMGVLGEDLENFLAYIPEKMSITDLMKIISTEAESAGVNVNRMGEFRSPSPSRVLEKGQFYEELAVELNLQGTYAQLLLFLSYLTKLDKILSVSQLSMESNAQQGDRESPIISFNCVILGYRYLLHSAAEKGENPK